MKKLKVNLMMVLALVIGAATMSFKMTKQEASETQAEETLWHYNSESTAPGAFADASNWKLGAGSACIQSGSKPCELTAEASDEEELDIFLSGRTNLQVMGIVDNQRN